VLKLKSHRRLVINHTARVTFSDHSSAENKNCGNAKFERRRREDRGAEGTEGVGCKTTGNSRSGIPGNSRESGIPKIPGGNFLIHGGNFRQF